MLGDLRGNSVEISREVAAAAVLNDDMRFPDFPLAIGRYGIEIDLRNLPGESEAGPGYWEMAKARIDEVVAHQLTEAIGSDQVAHLSVFAFARLPLLVYLGSRLDDNVNAEVYQRHRRTGRWEWLDEVQLSFEYRVLGDVTSAPEAVMILNISGTVSQMELPPELDAMPRFIVEPVDATPAPDLLTSRAGRDSFEALVRSLFADLEVTAGSLRRLHVFGALPMAAAVALGRCHDPHLRPALAIYNRDDALGTYSLALEIR
jgi:hypothetical protein